MTRENRPMVSVIIPTYNRAKFVTSAIDSVLAQTYKDFEIIVVDDGSTDNTRDVLEGYGDSIRYFYQHNQGVSGALNTGITNSRGDWIAFLGSDDEWLPDKLFIHMEAISKENRLCVHTVNATLMLERGKRENNMAKTGFLKEKINPSYIERPFEYQIKYGLSRVQCMIVKRDTLFRAGLFDTKLTMYEDQDMMCRLALEGPWGIETRELVRIIRREEEIDNLSVQRIRRPAQSYEGLIYAYKKLKHHPKLGSKERILVNKTISSYMAAAGMEFLKTGDIVKARYWLRQSIHEAFSVKGILRYTLSLFPPRVSVSLVRLWHNCKR